MKRSGFFDCLALDQVQRPAVEFEQPGDQSTELDAAAELAAFVAALRDNGRASLSLDARVPLPGGVSACDMRSRYVAIAKG